MKSILQPQLDSGNLVINLPKGEFKENVIIDRPCTIVGNNTTLWNENSPVLMVRSKGVTLKNLNLELTSITGYESDYAILQLQPDTIVENVEIYGGIANTKKFYIPRAVHLGEFKCNEENTFKLKVYLPEVCEFRVISQNFNVYTKNLNNGYVELMIVTNPLNDNAMLYGEILVISKFTRRIFVDGMAISTADIVTDRLLYSFENPPIDTKTEVFAVSVQKVDTTTATRKLETITANRGGRYNLYYNTLSMKLSFKATSKLEIDPYIFLTDENSTTAYSSDMVFFRNPSTENGSVTILSDNSVFLNLDKVPLYVKKICVCYAIYNSKFEQHKTFALANNLCLNVYTGNFPLIKFNLEDIQDFSTVVVAELYRYNGLWKIYSTMNGYHGNLPQLCEHFGIDADY